MVGVVVAGAVLLLLVDSLVPVAGLKLLLLLFSLKIAFWLVAIALVLLAVALVTSIASFGLLTLMEIIPE